MFPEKKIFLIRFYLLSVISLFIATQSISQIRRPPIRPPGMGGLQNLGNMGNKNNSDTISFVHRNDAADSITIFYKLFDSSTNHNIDISIDDFNKNFTLPADYHTIGGNGNAAFPILFSPNSNPGWDPGFHAYDIYQFTLENSRFFQTTRPFTQINFYQSSNMEQVIRLLHTQNIKPNWNAGFEYRMISNPGIFQNQNVKHNNYRFFSSYQGRKKRYALSFLVIGNNIISGENGGISDLSLLPDPIYKRRTAIPVKLGNNTLSPPAFFVSKISAGNRYSNTEFYLTHRYDFGKKDSIMINDSTKEYLFYPKLRFIHTFEYLKANYKFSDALPNFQTAQTDSVFFSDFYNMEINPTANDLTFSDQWKFISNDFSIRQFPETKNQHQYLEVGIRFENIQGSFTKPYIPTSILIINPMPPVNEKYFNSVLHATYKNKTRNQKWDMELGGEFYAAGTNIANYKASASVQRVINQKWGLVRLFGENISRTPSFVFQSESAFNLDTSSLNKKENITILGIMSNNPRFQLMARNISIANYAYLTNYFDKEQYTGFINLTQGTLSTKNKLSKRFNLYSNFIFQLTTGENPIHVPLFYTRQRLAFEGNFFKNLFLSTGLDVIYNTPYKADNYSPVLGRFFPQDSITISNRPQVSYYFDFRIKKFSAFIKLENLNTLNLTEGFVFNKNSFYAPYYPAPGLLFRFGIRWNMVN